MSATPPSSYLAQPGSPIQSTMPRQRPTLNQQAFMDPMRSVQLLSSPMNFAQQCNSGGPGTSGYNSPRLMRAGPGTPRRTSQSPVAGGAASPRMPRFVTAAEQSLSGSFRIPSTPTVASSQNFSTASGFSYASSGVASSASTANGVGLERVNSQHGHHHHTSSRGAVGSRPTTPMRPSSAVSLNTPPTVRLHHGSRPSSPSASVRVRARSPVLSFNSPASLRPSTPVSSSHHHHLQQQSSFHGSPLLAAGSGSYAAASASPTAASAATTPRGLLRELAASWRNRGSENQQAFGEGGYMAVNPGDVVNNRYELFAKLGWGEFSTVWLAFDRKATSLHRTFVAVKIAKCRADVTRGTKYECYLLAFVRKRVSREAPVASLIDCFEARGRHGDHLCMTMPLLGSNMLCVIEQFKQKGRRRRSDKELQLVKEVTVALLQALTHLAAANILHTDIKPENVLVSAPDLKVARQLQSFCRSRGILGADQLRQIEEGDARAPLATLADFGLSLLLEPSTTQDPHAQQVVARKELNVPKPGHLRNERGMLIQTREYRAPEVLFGTDFNCRTDIWSVGCMAYEMLTGDFLMDPKRKTRVEREMDVEHVAMMMQILGPVPSRITTSTTSGKHLRRFFDASGRFLYADHYAAYPRRSIAAELEAFLEPAEAERAAQFIMSCFTYDPAERCHADDLLRHSWLRSTAAASVAVKAAASPVAPSE